MKKRDKKNGFSLIEVLIVIGIVAILSSVVIIGVNPARELAKTRNDQRRSNINLILNAVVQRTTDNRGVFETGCVSGVLPTSSKKMAVGSGNYDIAPCLVPAYLPILPFDPTATSAHYATTTDYDTGYNIQKNATTSRVTISAPSAELGETISVTR